MDPTQDGSLVQSMMDGPSMTHDSMVTVRLSEPPSLTVDTNVLERGNADTPEPTNGQEVPQIMQEEENRQEDSPRITMVDPNGNEVTSPSGSESVASRDPESRRGSDTTEESAGKSTGKSWRKRKSKSPGDEGSDDVS